jgi:hypothetical protein
MTHTLDQQTFHEECLEKVQYGPMIRMESRKDTLKRLNEEAWTEISQQVRSVVVYSPQEVNTLVTILRGILKSAWQFAETMSLWYNSKDETKARAFFKATHHLSQQFLDGNSATVLKEFLTITIEEAKNYGALIESLAREIPQAAKQGPSNLQQQQIQQKQPPLQGMDSESSMRDLVTFMNASGLPLEVNPVVSDHPVNLWMLFEAVASKGGYEMATRRQAWRLIAHALRLPSQLLHVPQTLKQVYERNLLKFEEWSTEAMKDANFVLSLLATRTAAATNRSATSWAAKA